MCIIYTLYAPVAIGFQASDVVKESQLDYEPQLIELHSYKHVDSALQAVL